MSDTDRYFVGMAIVAAAYFFGLAGYTLHRREMPRGHSFFLHRRRPPLRGSRGTTGRARVALTGVLFLALAVFRR